MASVQPSFKPLKRLGKMLYLDRKDIYLVSFYAFFAGLLGLGIPLGIQAIINYIAIGETTTSWYTLCFLITGASVAVGITRYMQVLIAEGIQQRIFTRSAFEFAYRIPRFKMESIREAYAPELANRFFDTLSVQKGVPKLIIDLPASVLQILFGLILLATYHPFFVFFGLTLLFVLVAILYFTYQEGLASSLRESKYKYKVAYWLEELGRTMGSFKLAGRTQYPLEKTDELVGSYLKHRQSHFAVYRQQFMSMVGVRGGATLALLLLGGGLVISNEMNIGQFVAAEIMIIMVLNALEKIILSMETVFDVLTAIEKIAHVTDLPLEEEEGIDFQEIVGNKGIHLRVHKMSYHPEPLMPPVLKDISFELGGGEHLCITGFADSGKTTLLRILLGLYQNFKGTIDYNQMPIRNLNLSSLRSYMGDYLREEHLFYGNLLENIAMGRKDVTAQDVLSTCRAVGLDRFLQEHPEGLDAMIPSDGQGLSQSTIKKILLARCIVDHPRFLAAENLLVGLESREKRMLTNLLTAPNAPWTLVAVSRSSELAARCKRVIVLDKGEIIFNGCYNELKKQAYFNELFDGCEEA